ncbi:hypothetical protein Hanom_Chr03g00246781 [Helianthus anomalus]
MPKSVDKEADTIPKEKNVPKFKEFSWGIGTSFKDVLMGDGEMEEPTMAVDLDDDINAFCDLHGKALVMRLVNLDALRLVNKTLNNMILGGGRIQYIGGLMILVTCFDKATAENVRLEAISMPHIFSSMTLWTGQSFCYERLVWIKVQGIPLHLLNNEVVDRIGSMFGTVVHKANIGSADGDLSFEYIGILVGDGKRINQEVLLRWKGRKYQVWVVEEIGDWSPEFWSKSNTSQDNSGQGKSSEVNSPAYDNSPVAAALNDDQNPILETNEKYGNEVNKIDEELRLNNGNNLNMENGHINEEGSRCNYGIELEEGEICMGKESEVNGSDNSANHYSFSCIQSKKRRKHRKFKRNGQLPSFSPNGPNLKKSKPNNIVDSQDPFDLDRFLGPMNCDSFKAQVDVEERNAEHVEGPVTSYENNNSTAPGDNGGSLDLNSRPDEGAPVTPPTPTTTIFTPPVIEPNFSLEVGKTVTLGMKLGAQLQDFDVLIREAIEDEGTQLVNL